jgi:porin
MGTWLMIAIPARASCPGPETRSKIGAVGLGRHLEPLARDTERKRLAPTRRYRLLRATVFWLPFSFLLPSAYAQEARTEDEDGGIGDAIEHQLIYTGDIFGLASGGLESGADYLADVSIAATLDAAALVGWSGASLFVYGVGNYGDDPSARIGDFQGVSNIAAPRDVRIYEAWLQQNIEHRLSILFGIYDINSEFDVIEAAGLFLHSSFGIGPEFGLSSPSGPSTFPFTTIGARISGQPVPSLHLMAAVMDGEARHIDLSSEDGLLLAGEASILAGSPGEPLATQRRLGRGRSRAPYRTKLAVGGWHYTRDFPRLGSSASPQPLNKGGNIGVYGLLEHVLTVEPSRPGQGLTGFLQVGWADPDVNLVTFYAGGGAVYDGTFSGRDGDRFGAGIAAAFLGGRAREAAAAAGRDLDRAEITLEFTYRAILTSHFTIQPDLQYVINPGADSDVSNALVLGLRFELEP